MSLKEQITEDMKAAMRAKDTAKLSAIRLITAAMKQKKKKLMNVLNSMTPWFWQSSKK